jgi:hypothetical protein
MHALEPAAGTRTAVLPFLAPAAVALLLSSCAGDGHFTVLGYTTRPNYDTHIKTVYVPIFQNLTYYRGLEFDLTRAVIREIETKTPYKVVSNRDAADTELTGKIKLFYKRLLNRNQLNEVREAETTLGVELVWRDLRTGEVLSKPVQGLNQPLTDVPPPPDALSAPGMPVAPLPPPPPGSPHAPLEPPPVVVMSTGNFIPELGESITTAQQKSVNRLAVQIVSMMEKPW